MSIKNRVAKLECGSTGKFSLEIVEAKDIETALDAVTRVAAERGLALDQAGYAWVFFPDNETEEYITVADPSRLIGWISHEQALKELN